MGIPLQKSRRSGEFEARVESHDKTVWVRVRGALDFYSVREAKSLLLDLLEHEPARVVVDVSDAFVDSSGIGVLVHIAQRARLERRDFRLVCREQLAVILRLHRLDAVLGIAPTMDVEEVGWGPRLAA